MVLSKTTRYAILSIIYIASVADRPFVPIREIADYLGISFYFLSKIMQRLMHKKIIETYRGPNGGISLARPANEIHLVEIVEAVDGLDLFTECILGLAGCGQQNPCPLHDGWSKIRPSLQEMFEQTNLKDIGIRIKAEDLRLKDEAEN